MEFRAAGGLRPSRTQSRALKLKLRGLIVIEGNSISHHEASQHHSYGASFTPRRNSIAVLCSWAVARSGDRCTASRHKAPRSGLFAASSYHRVSYLALL